MKINDFRGDLAELSAKATTSFNYSWCETKHGDCAPAQGKHWGKMQCLKQTVHAEFKIKCKWKQAQSALVKNSSDIVKRLQVAPERLEWCAWYVWQIRPCKRQMHTVTISCGTADWCVSQTLYICWKRAYAAAIVSDLIPCASLESRSPRRVHLSLL